MSIDFNHLWTEKNLTLCLRLGSLVVIMMICLNVYDLLKIRAMVAQSEAQQVEQSGIKVQKNADDSPFGTLFGAYLSSEVDPSMVKETMLDIELVGVLFDEKTSQSQVIIKISDDEEKNFSIGDQLQSGAVIKQILPDGILLEYNGRLERLKLPSSQMNFEPAPKPLFR